VLDFAKSVERHFARWSWGRLAAAAALAMVIVALCGLLLPERVTSIAAIQTQLGQSLSVNRLLDRRDTRGYTVPGTLPPADDTFDLAIISDSGLLVKSAPENQRYKNMPQYSAIAPFGEYVASVNGKRLVIHEYFNTGMRSADQRRLILNAVNDPRIDAAIITINPLMAFNDLMPFGVSDQRLRSLQEPGATWWDWSSLLITMRPSHFALEAASVASPLFAARFRLGGGSPFVSRRLGIGRVFPFYADVRNEVRWQVPYLAEWLFPAELVAHSKRSAPDMGGYALMTMTSDLSDNGFGVGNLRASLRSLKDWGKPVVIYVPPIAPAFVKSSAFAPIAQVIDRVRLIGLQAAAPNIRMVTRTATMANEDWVYFDGYHPRQGRHAVMLLADLLESELKLKIVRNNIDAIIPPPKPWIAIPPGGKPVTPPAPEITLTCSATAACANFDIVLVAGQSNATSRGIPRRALPAVSNQGIWQIGRRSNEARVIAAAEPIDHVTWATRGTGFTLPFARLYRDQILQPGRQVLIIPVAKGSTGVVGTKAYWRPGGEGYLDAKSRLNAALRQFPGSRLAVILWHQGETDAASDPIGYRQDVATLLADLRGEAQAPVILGQLAESFRKAVMLSNWIDRATLSIPKILPNSAVAVSAALPTFGLPPKGGAADATHFTAEAQLVLGQRFFCAYLALARPDYAFVSSKGCKGAWVR
jgi:hypothetical protein